MVAEIYVVVGRVKWMQPGSSGERSEGWEGAEFLKLKLREI